MIEGYSSSFVGPLFYDDDSLRSKYYAHEWPVLVEVRVGPLRFRYYADEEAPPIYVMNINNVGQSEFDQERIEGHYEEVP